VPDISSVLFDADGVVQSVPDDWLQQWEDFMVAPGDTKQFVSDIFAAEAPHAIGEPEFTASIEKVLRKWNLLTKIDAVLEMWKKIILDEEIFALIQKIRNAGTFVGLATNQHHYRLEYMQNSLKYSDYFDELYVSCEIGYKKPSSEYFSYIINRLDCDSSKILFVDDSEENVIGAQNLGINAARYHMKEGVGRLSDLLASYGIKCS